MRPLNVTRFKQDRSHCAVAAAASVANYSNPNINYQLAKYVAEHEVVKTASEGLYSGETGQLLNHLGFKSVSLVTCDLDLVDHSWVNLSKEKKILAIDEMLKSRSIDSGARASLKSIKSFLLQPNRNNNLIIDSKFANHIRASLDKGNPLVISFNWNMLLGFPKQLDNGQQDFVKGSFTYHATCGRGYTSKGVYIVDSHHEYYKRQWKKYRNGYYFVPWEELLIAMGNTDILIAEDYDSELLKYELVQESVD